MTFTLNLVIPPHSFVSFYISAQASRVVRFWNAPSTSGLYVATPAPTLQPGAVAAATADGAIVTQTGYSYSGQPSLTAFSSTPFNLNGVSNGFSTGRLVKMSFSYKAYCPGSASTTCLPSPPPLPPSPSPSPLPLPSAYRCQAYSITGDTAASSSQVSRSCIATVCAGQTLTYGTTAVGMPALAGAAVCSSGDTYINLFDVSSGNAESITLSPSSLTFLSYSDNDAQLTSNGNGGGCDNSMYVVPAGSAITSILIGAGCHNQLVPCAATPAWSVSGPACAPATPAPSSFFSPPICCGPASATVSGETVPAQGVLVATGLPAGWMATNTVNDRPADTLVLSRLAHFLSTFPLLASNRSQQSR